MDVFASPRFNRSQMNPAADTDTVKNRPQRALGLGLGLSLVALAVAVVPLTASADTPAQAKRPSIVIRIDKSDTRDVQALSVEERVQRGVVRLERAGQPLGLGTVLMGDGRILTALSPLGPNADRDNIDARFADGSVSRVKLGQQDKAWDLALLVPQTVRWQEGLAASSRNPVRQDAVIRGISRLKSKVSSNPILLRSYRGFLGGDDSPIEHALEIGSHVNPQDVGAPLVDEEGQVVGILGRGCQPNENRACTPVAFGTPVSAIRNFLRNVPPMPAAAPVAALAPLPAAAPPPPAPWLGIQGVPDISGVAKGVRVMGVHPKSPAAESKIGDGDVILAVAGTPVTTPETLAEAIRSHGIGEKIPLTLLSKGKYRDVNVVLRPAPGAPR